VKIALLQMTSGVDPAVNAQVIEAAIADAATAGAEMLFTPEMSGLIDRNRERARHHIAAEQDDFVLKRSCAAAKAHSIWLSLGSLALRREGDQLVNRGFIIDDTGIVRAHFDKMHLFDVTLASGESWRESAAYGAGTEPMLCETPLGPLGMSICYDIRFPALFAAYGDAGARILIVPAAFTVPTGRDHWECLLRARAIENAAFVIAAAQTGQHQDGRETYGHSLVIDPWGNVLLDMGEEAALGFAEIDLSQVDVVRGRIPVLEHRRDIPQVNVR
jgi:deaminated glutathione amidase